MDAKKLAEILGTSDAAAWNLTGAGASIATEASETSVSGPNGFNIEGAVNHSAPTEYLFTYRLVPGAGAKSHDVWVSPYPDGRGAIQLATGWTEPGGLIQGLRPETVFYAFITYTDKDGKLAKPSASFSFKLKDRFGYK